MSPRAVTSAVRQRDRKPAANIGCRSKLATELKSVLGANPEANCHPLGRPMQRTLVVIPARMQSTRLPDKPLADIAGRPMIVHVWRRAMEARVGRVVVATDNDAVLATVRAAGCLLYTSPSPRD